MKLMKLSALFMLMIVVAACQPRQESAVALPTLAVLPSTTPTLTPTLTLTPTPTLTQTATSTDTPTNTPTPTFTPTATSTARPTATFTPSITPTFTLTPTFTPTSTFTATATPDKPQIISFNASANNVTGNSSVTLTWQASGDSARIDQLNAQGAVSQSYPVQTAGQLPVTVPGNLGQLVIYRLVAIRGGQEVHQDLPITVQCAIAWFFGTNPYPNAGCPTAVGAIGQGAFQQFERGFMIYVNANGLNTVFGLQTQDSRYIQYTNGWNGTDTAYGTCPGSPPSGLFAPQQQFLWAYCNTNAPVGSWNSAVGWAISNIDTGNRTIQYEEGTGAFYIDSPVGVFRFSGPTPSGATWARVK